MQRSYKELDNVSRCESAAVTCSSVGTGDDVSREPSFRATSTWEKLFMPSRPQRDIIALSSSHGEPTRHTSNSVRLTIYQMAIERTRSGKHLFACKHRIGTSHEAHRLLVLTERLSTSGQPDDGLREHYTSGSDSPQNSLVGNRL